MCLCCTQKQCISDFTCETRETKDGVTMKIKAKSPQKAQALKKMVAAHKELCGKCKH